MQTILFAGPSLTDRAIQEAARSGVAIYPPIRRHDLPTVLQQGFAGNIVIADGLFHQVLSVGHREIRDALAVGCKVFGLSSMGAIRAYEMQQMGVIGYGRVYDWFLHEPDFDDDEVTLLHENAMPYRAVSEPMVHLRECLKDLVARKVISAVVEKQVVGELKKLYYGDRTMSIFKKLLKQLAGVSLDEVVKDFNVYRIKQSDLEDFLQQDGWLM